VAGAGSGEQFPGSHLYIEARFRNSNHLGILGSSGDRQDGAVNAIPTAVPEQRCELRSPDSNGDVSAERI